VLACRALPLAAGLAAMLVAMPASAKGLCDPDGHFCIQVDTTGAVICDLTRSGGLDPETCKQEDLALRDQVRAAQWPIFAALVLRVDGRQVLVGVAKRPPTPELSGADVTTHANRVRAMAEASRKIDAFAPPRVSRIHDVQVIRLESVWTEGDHRVAEIAMEVHAKQGVYAVSFQGPAGPQLSALADGVMATLDTLPAGRASGLPEFLKWLVAACSAAMGFAVVKALLGRRKGRGIDARTLWPPRS
jgi:hypothetical protein